MTAQQQEPTMREEIAAVLRDQSVTLVGYEARTPMTAIGLLSGGSVHEIADAVLAVLERRGDDDAARVRRVQICPKCNGQGTVAKPPWIPGDVHQWSSGTLSPHRCNLCDGRMVIALDGDDTGSGQ